MSHEAYTVHSLAKLSVHIESIAAYDNKIILGTRQGQLLTYSVDKKDDKMELTLVNFDKNFSKKPIVQIEVLPKEFLLFTLSDSLLSVCHIEGHNFLINHTAPQTKGASIFCVDVITAGSMTAEVKTVVRICVAIKRKLYFFDYEDDKLIDRKIYVELKDLPKAISMFNEYVCVGFNNEYVLYAVSESGTVKHDLINTSSSYSQDPCICQLNNIFGLIKDQYLIRVDPKVLKGSESKPLKPLEWSQLVLDLVWDDPFIIGRTANCLEVRCFESNGLNKESLIQSFPELGKARFIKNAGKGAIFAAAISELWYIESIDIAKQIQSLQAQKKFQLAIALTKISDKTTEEKEEIVKTIQTRLANELFRTKQFDAAMKEFKESQTHPFVVIRLFPNLYPNDSQRFSPSHGDLNVAELEDKDLENALQALQEYLDHVKKEEVDRLRKSIDKKESKQKVSPLLSLLDTTLLKTYLQTNNSQIESLLREGNCNFDESEKTLIKYKKFSELNILYNTNGKHQKALELLKSQSVNEGTRLYGCEQTIKYLQTLGAKNKYLIFEHSDWVLKKDPTAGLKIFTENFPEVKNLPRAEVLDFLLKGHKSLVIPYLEHTINEWHEEHRTFHNVLINQYRKEIDFLKNELLKNPESSETSESMKKTRHKLLNFLKTSNRYVPENVLKELPTNDLFEERAIILGKLKKHIKVLVIYIHVLGDVDKAKQYCEQVYAEENGIWVHLIKCLLNVPSTPPYSGVELNPMCLQPNTEVVLDILQKYGSKIDPVEVLMCLPNDLPVHRLKDFLESSLRTNLEKRRHYQVLSGLLTAEYLELKDKLMMYETKSIVLTELKNCPICRKRFTNQSAFVKYPDGEIVHFSCQDKKN